MSDFTRSREIVRTLLLSQHKRPHRISRVTDARILRTRVWVESVLSDNHLCRRELQSAFFGDERESTGTVLRWLKAPCVRIVVASVFHSIKQEAEVRYE